jgi:hypothetical protein
MLLSVRRLKKETPHGEKILPLMKVESFFNQHIGKTNLHSGYIYRYLLQGIQNLTFNEG